MVRGHGYIVEAQVLQGPLGAHLRYSKDDPVFLTTLEADLMCVQTKTLDGSRDMMLKQLNISRFHGRLQNPDRTIPACTGCFVGSLV